MTDDLKYYDPTYNTFHNQSITDANIEAAMEVPDLEAIFANANPGEYFNQVLAVAVYQAHMLDRIRQFINNFQ